MTFEEAKKYKHQIQVPLNNNPENELEVIITPQSPQHFQAFMQELIKKDITEDYAKSFAQDNQFKVVTVKHVYGGIVYKDVVEVSSRK